MAQNYYDVLNVPRDSSVDDIKKAYKKKALEHHPDKGGDTEKFKECSAAHETLTDVQKRAAYDSSLLRARSRDGLRFSYPDRDLSADRQRGASVPTASTSQRSSQKMPMPTASTAQPPRPPRPPGQPTGAVEIPSDPSVLSARELKELLTALGINHDGCLEKADLLEVLKQRRSGRPTAADSREATPRSAEGEKPSTPRDRGAAGAEASRASRGRPDAGAEASGGQAKDMPRALRIKILSIGSEAVGKSCLIKRYCEGRFVQKYITTIGVDYGVKPVQILGHNVKANFFDTSGGDEYKEIRVEFYENASGVVLVYDVTSRRTFEDLEAWLEEAARHGCPLARRQKPGDSPFVVLCGNKSDLPKPRQVPKADGMQFAAQHGMYFYETSGSSGENVTEALTFLFEKVVGHHIEVRKRLMAG